MRKSIVAAAVAAALALVAGAVVIVEQITRPPGKRPAASGGIWPAPQRYVARADGFDLPERVGVVRADGTDAPALAALTALLRGAGVRDIVTADRDPGTEVTVWLDGGGPILERLGVEDATGLPAEGYVLVVGREPVTSGNSASANTASGNTASANTASANSASGGGRGRCRIVVDAADPAGTFYAVQTLRQLVHGSPGAATVTGAAVRDWPAMALRGSIEGFYGTPWTQQEALDHIDYLAAHRMNSFAYSPKDDPYLRERWRDPFPADRLAQLRELIDRGRAQHVTFTLTVSPGLSMCYSSASDIATLLSKLDAVHEVGGRSFMIALDDIDYNQPHCPEDPARFGTGAAGAGRAQSALLGEVARWARERGDVDRPQFVPTEYYDVADSPYKQAVRRDLDRDVIVFFTGVNVIASSITRAQIAAVRRYYGHDVMLWDNYPVNDYEAGRLTISPYTGREAGMSEDVVGILANPAVQPAISKIGLFSVAAFTWRDTGYDPDTAWAAALAERTGGDPAAVAALRVLADACAYDGYMHLVRAPAMAEAVERFWRRWRAGDREGAVAGLRRHADALAAAPERIRAGADPAFVAQGRPWLDAAALWGRAMQAALDVLAAETARDRDAAAGARTRLRELVTQANAVRGDREPHTKGAPFIGDGVIDVFVGYVASGFATHPPEAVTSLGTYQDNAPFRMVDGDPGTSYSSDGAPGTDDWIGVDLGRPRRIGLVVLQMGTPDSPDDYVHHGVIEYSVDNTTWQSLVNGDGRYVRATAPEGTVARYVRYRLRAGNDGDWISVNEFTVNTLDAPRG